MKVGVALDRLLSRLQPVSPVDAGLAEVGLLIDHPLEALVVRALALDAPLGRTDLAAFVAASPRPRGMRGGLRSVGAAARRLIKRGLIEGPQNGPYRLAERLEGRVAHFPRLIGPEHGAPPLDLPAAAQVLADGPAAPLTAGVLAAAFDGAPVDFAGPLAALEPGGRALLDWVGRAVLAAPLRITLDHAMQQVGELSSAALGVRPPAARAFAATWLTFADALGRVLDPQVLTEQADRRLELLRRWAWFVGCPIAADGLAGGVEPPLISGAALVRLDWRRILADNRQLEVMQQAEEAAQAVLAAERTRRAEAARAYASGRRE